ncbi:hypothetical protein BT96DRAFT_939559 [Gymnopus androsaceus JB14]|uniref:Protein kinase domain-containing protein n=1 Tax=Gymnopus androsaceus JB14 TaxID=1447944 RepID=A0A6A4HMM5_9AGAR|nr:hypothetical protein BT96DRAFT_939559 [Gymnopus androsaceus JB14]
MASCIVQTDVLAFDYERALTYPVLRVKIFEHAKSQEVFDGVNITPATLEQEFKIFPTTDENEVSLKLHAEEATQTDFSFFVSRQFSDTATVEDCALLFAIIPSSSIDNLPFIELDKQGAYLRQILYTAHGEDNRNKSRALPSPTSQEALDQCLRVSSGYEDTDLGQNEESFRLEGFHYYSMLFNRNRGDCYTDTNPNRELAIGTKFIGQLQHTFSARNSHVCKGNTSKASPIPGKFISVGPDDLEFHPSPDFQSWRGSQIMWHSKFTLKILHYTAQVWYMFWTKTRFNILQRNIDCLIKMRHRKAEFLGVAGWIANQLYEVELCSFNSKYSKNRSTGRGGGPRGVKRPLDDDAFAEKRKTFLYLSQSNSNLHGQKLILIQANGTSYSGYNKRPTQCYSPDKLLEHHGWFFTFLPYHTSLTNHITCPMLPLADGLLEDLSFLHDHGIAHIDLNPGLSLDEQLMDTTEELVALDPEDRPSLRNIASRSNYFYLPSLGRLEKIN